jgi:hypothetical protein
METIEHNIVNEPNYKLGIYFLGIDKRKINLLEAQLGDEYGKLEDFLELLDADITMVSKDKIKEYLDKNWKTVALILVDLILNEQDQQVLDEIKGWTASRLREAEIPNFESQKIVEYIRDFRRELARKVDILDFPQVLVVIPDLPDGIESLGSRLRADWWAIWRSEGLEFLDLEDIRELLKRLYTDWVERVKPQIALDD